MHRSRIASLACPVFIYTLLGWWWQSLSHCFSSEVKETVLIRNIKLRVVFTDWSVRFRRSKHSAAQLERHKRGHDLAGGKSNQLLFKPFHLSPWRWYPKIQKYIPKVINYSSNLFTFHCDEDIPKSQMIPQKQSAIIQNFLPWRRYPKIPNDIPKGISYYSNLFTFHLHDDIPDKSNHSTFKRYYVSGDGAILKAVIPRCIFYKNKRNDHH